MRFRTSENTRAVITGIAASILAVLMIRVISGSLTPSSPEASGLTKSGLARAIAEGVKTSNYPERLEVAIKPGTPAVPVQVRYAFDPQLQETMESLFKTYRP